jgi:hypothetical protein
MLCPSRSVGPRQRLAKGWLGKEQGPKARVTRSNRVGCAGKACAGRAGTVAASSLMDVSGDGSFRAPANEHPDYLWRRGAGFVRNLVSRLPAFLQRLFLPGSTTFFGS